MRILQVSIFDNNGGAEKVALDLHHAYKGHNIDSLLLVGQKRHNTRDVVGLWKTGKYSSNIILKLLRRFEYESGIQAMGYYKFGQWWRNNANRWDIVHVHNLHSGYFDLSCLPKISSRTRLVQTLHDCWVMTGHCAHPKDCEGWRHGCGNCPDLSSYPAIGRDLTGFNWKRKRKLYRQANPVLVVPSRWLLEKVEASFLGDLRCELIYNGIDVKKFAPGDQVAARLELDLPLNKRILLYVANGGLRARGFKDPDLALDTILKLRKLSNFADVVLLVVGGEIPLPPNISKYVIQRPAIIDGLERYYQAADMFLHCSRADNCPLVILEAMACGLPVVTTKVGGCGELVVDGISGYVAEIDQLDALFNAVKKSLETEILPMKQAALERVRNYFSLDHMVERYLELYDELLSR